MRHQQHDFSYVVFYGIGDCVNCAQLRRGFAIIDRKRTGVLPLNRQSEFMKGAVYRNVVKEVIVNAADLRSSLVFSVKRFRPRRPYHGAPRADPGEIFRSDPPHPE
jgi:hypothetical protein